MGKEPRNRNASPPEVVGQGKLDTGVEDVPLNLLL